MDSDKNFKPYIQLEIARKLSQIESAFSFLDYMNNELENAPRNMTERSSISRNHARVKEVRQLFNQLLQQHRHEKTKVAGSDQTYDNK